jgi:uncharacterized LabA/DUF88 family protein
MISRLLWTKAVCFLFVLPDLCVTSFALPPRLRRLFRWVTRNENSPKSPKPPPLTRSGTDEQRLAFALLIDAENASPASFDLAMNDIKKRGIETPIRRIFGKTPMLKQRHWQTIIRKHSLIPIYCQELVDMDLALDAMDILYTKDFVRGFVLFSSDADFTRLVQRIRENNLTVLGIGQRLKTNFEKSLASACHEFVYTEDLVSGAVHGQSGSVVQLGQNGNLPLQNVDFNYVDQKNEDVNPIAVVDSQTQLASRIEVVQSLKMDLKAMSPSNDWVYLSMLTARSGCDLRDTGYTKMSKFVQAHRGDFDIKLDGTSFKVRLRA